MITGQTVFAEVTYTVGTGPAAGTLHIASNDPATAMLDVPVSSRSKFWGSYSVGAEESNPISTFSLR